MKNSFASYFLIFLLFSSCGLIDGRKNPTKIDSNEDLQDYLIYGWNTWNNPNLLDHVLMPYGLSLRVNFRTTMRFGGAPYYLNEAYISSPKHDFPERITPFGHAYDGSYTELILDWKGLSARIQTAVHGENIYILYTPMQLPEHPPLLILEAGMLWNKEGTVSKNDDFLQADLGTKSFGIGATRNDSLIPLPLKTHYLSFTSDSITGFYTGKKKSLEYIQKFIATRKKQFEEKKSSYGEMAEAYNAQQTLLAWNIIYDAFNHRAITPVSRVWNEGWGGWVLFDWDTYFTAAMYAIDNKYHAFSNAIAITDEVTPAGFIPNFSGTLINQKSFDRSQPPVGSYIVKMIYDKYPERWFLEEVYENLLSWNRWWPEERDNMGYLSWGSDPVENYQLPKARKSNTKQGAMFESGLDNSPLFDEAEYNPEKNMLELASVGLMSLYIADCKALAEMAEILDKTQDAIELRERAEKYSASLRKLWDEESGIYRDLNLITGDFSSHLAPTNFYPLLARVPSQEQAEMMIQKHFMNPREFFGTYMLPSIARNDPAYEDNSYWRGRIWAPMNFLVYLGLRNYDLPEARSILAKKSYDLLMKEWQANRRVYENYNAETGIGSDVRYSDGFYSWGGLLGLIALMEEGYWNEIPSSGNK
ncbi:MAG: MGH1-like glycoside hydrolase domain-containing protein [bacterium]